MGDMADYFLGLSFEDAYEDMDSWGDGGGMSHIPGRRKSSGGGSCRSNYGDIDPYMHHRRAGNLTIVATTERSWLVDIEYSGRFWLPQKLVKVVKWREEMVYIQSCLVHKSWWDFREPVKKKSGFRPGRR